MKLRHSVYIVIILGFLLMLSACKQVYDPEQTDTTDTTVIPETEEISEPSLFLNSEPSAECETLLKLVNPFGETELYPELYSLGENLLAIDKRNSDDGQCTLKLKLVSSKTGILIAENELICGWEYTVFPANNYLLIADPNSDKASIFDKNLNCTEYTIEDNENYASYYIDENAHYLYTYLYNADSITVTDLETSEKQKISPNGTGIMISSVSPENACLKCTDIKSGKTLYYSMDLATGKFSPLPYEGRYLITGCGKNYRIAEIESISNTFRADFGEDSFIFNTDAISSSFDENSEMIIMRRYDEDGVSPRICFSAYSKDGTLISSCFIDCTHYVSTTPVYSPLYNGFFFLVGNYLKDTISLQFWDCSLPGSGNDLNMTPISEFLPAPDSNDAVASVLYEQAKDLEDRYGFDLLIAEQAELQFNDFSAVPCTDYWCILSGLNQLEDALENFPEGFFALLPHDDLQNIRIHFTGPLTSLNVPETGEVFENYQAFVSYSLGCYSLVIDVFSSGNLVTAFCHEFSHMIDSKLESDSCEREDALFSNAEWCSLNPQDFEYSYSYTELSDSMQIEKYFDYFIDTYSRTFPTEDRARIMEYAINSPWIFNESNGLLSKLDYYSRCIRDGLDTGDWPNILAWEQPLYDYGFRTPIN